MNLPCESAYIASPGLFAAIDSARIDQINIYQASRLAMLHAVRQLNPASDPSSSRRRLALIANSPPATNHSWRRPLRLHCRGLHSSERSSATA